MDPIRALAAVCLGLMAALPARAQTATFMPGNDLDLWNADTLYVGASFVRTSSKPVEIWLRDNEAAWSGELYLMDPATGKPIFLFSNKGTRNQAIDISKLADIPIGVPITFAYKVVPNPCTSAEDLKWKYTGPNTAGSKYVSAAASDANNNPNARYGHRWAVAGKVKNTDLLEFGFEDATPAWSDMDFDDVIFQVKGLGLGKFQRRTVSGSWQW